MGGIDCLFEQSKKYERKVNKNKQIKKAIAFATNKTITLCGSTDYKYEYERLNKILTLAGNVVLSCGVFRQDFHEIENYRDVLETVHRKKIDMSEIILVINVDGHIGTHTASEISYATVRKKEIRYLYDNGEKML